MTRRLSPPPARDVLETSGRDRTGVFDLGFGRHGCRTVIEHQLVSYPFHFTRPFWLDAAIPALSTVYQQSSSGGLYRGDDLFCRYRLGAGTACHITTQAATVVHDCQGIPVRQYCEMTLEEGAFLALAPDPYVLFPGASIYSNLSARLGVDAVLLVTESFSMHDPQATGRQFGEIFFDTKIFDLSEHLLVRDCFRVAGSNLTGNASPIGQWRIVMNFLLLGSVHRLPRREDLAGIGSSADSIIGVTAAPNYAGWGVRCLAVDAVAARRIADRIFCLSVRSAFGNEATKRRK